MRPDGSDAHKAFDADKDSSFGGVEFSPDGRRLAYIKLRQSPELGEESFESRPFEGGRPLSARSWCRFPQDMEDWAWSPDGRLIYSVVPITLKTLAISGR